MSRGKIKKAVMVFMVIALVIGSMMLQADAYFDRGNVTPVLGQGSLSVYTGSSGSVSCTLSPASDRQLPGCGMAECPQVCGEQNCLDSNGQCTCCGTTYQTYYSEAEVTSSNSSVATASYSSGAVTVHGVSAGTATITVTASLRQHTSQAASFNVTVSETPSNSPNKGRSDSGSSSSSKKSKAVKVKGSDESKDEEKAEEEEEKEEKEKSIKKKKNTRTIKSKKGSTVILENIIDGTQGKDIFKKIKGSSRKAQFRKTGEGDTVLYSWTFKGGDIEKVKDMNLNIDIAEKLSGRLLKLAGSTKACRLTFAEDGDFAGKGTVYMPCPTTFSEKEGLCLYRYDQDKLTLCSDDLAVENGYVSMEVSRGGTYILSEGSIQESSSVSTGLIAGIAVLVLVILAFAVYGIYRRKKK